MLALKMHGSLWTIEVLCNAFYLNNRDLVTVQMFYSLTVLFGKIADRPVLTNPILWLIETSWPFTTYTNWE